MIENTIVYEQPLNELVRACLRLEHVFHQIDHQINDPSVFAARNIISGILNILNLLDRPDLKAKLAKELSYHMTSLSRLKTTPQIDQEKLSDLLLKLDDLIRNLIDSNGKIGQNLRDVEMLNNLRLHLNNPGGGCSFDIPIFHQWLQQPAPQRQLLLQKWLNEFSKIRSTVTVLLKLIREGTKPVQKNAQQGFYQEMLDPQLNLRMIRVAIPQDSNAYPEISVGRHLLNVRFFNPTLNERPSQATSNVAFWLAC